MRALRRPKTSKSSVKSFKIKVLGYSLMRLRLLPHRAGGKCAELWGCMLKNDEARDALGWFTAVQEPKEHNF